ncbi:MAG: 3-diacylglucosamine hydrolase [Francisellaceae bacterium]|nr:3-diacylglucosamine hydrolase [Francisellaceae bacterium]
MSIIFISDLHLSENHPKISELFFKFLETEAKEAEVLYILGDFFQYWIGEDIINEYDKNIMHKLSEYTASGKTLYFMVGNRDFLIGEKFAKAIGAHLLQDPSLIKVYNKPIIICHGDSLCTNDKAYQIYRTIVRSPLIKKLFLSFPQKWRRNIAKRIRNISSNKNYDNNNRGEVAQSAVEKLMTKFNTDILIHGHTHKPCIHQFSLNNKPAKRIVLGDWDDGTTYLKCTPEGFNLEKLRL